jgi:TonB family protein
VAVPQSDPDRSVKITDALDRAPFHETSSTPSAHIVENTDQRPLLSSLKELIAARNHALDPILQTITDVARQLTGASGAALAMWKDGAMVCRARSGDIAPALGAQLSAETGISGECLRAGKIQNCADTENDPIVDLDVCRSLGVRSIAALPIRSWRGVNGILEVFSTRPAAFSELHIALLQKLAVLAERARSALPESASSAVPDLPWAIDAWAIDATYQSRPVTASHRVRNVALISRATRARPFVLFVLGIIVIALLALAFWRGGRSLERSSRETYTARISANPADANPANVRNAIPKAPDAMIARPADSDTMGKPNPGSESASHSYEELSIGSPVKLASKVDTVTGTKSPAQNQVDQSLPTGDVAPNVVLRYGVPGSQSGSKTRSPAESLSNLRSDAVTSVVPLSIPPTAATSSALNGVFSAKAALPRLSIPSSQGVSGGQLVHRVQPLYPAQARVLRLEGKVVLAAVITEEGKLSDVKVVEGPPVLAQSAVEAVKQWRYKPYELDGKPVKNEIRINIDFKFPEQTR